MHAQELKTCKSMLLILTLGSKSRPCRLIDRQVRPGPVKVIGYDSSQGAWAKFMVKPANVRIPVSGDASICEAAHKSMVWMQEDSPRIGGIPLGTDVRRQDWDAVTACGPDDHADGVIVDRSKRRGLVRVAWLVPATEWR